MLDDRRLVVLSNRLPFTLEKEDGEWTVAHSSGGLVTALNPVLQEQGGLWIGWPGTTEEVDINELLQTNIEDVGYRVEPVALTEEELNNFYYGFSNEIIWPLFHDLQTRCNFFAPNYWTVYQAVNRKYAQVTADHVGEEDYIWVQDYQLILAGRELRELGVQAPIGFFLHIPFPSPDIFLKLPWRRPILYALLQYNLIGFQTPGDCDNFLQCVNRLIEEAQIVDGGGTGTVRLGHNETRVGSFPISIDFDEFAQSAGQPEVTARVRTLREEQGVPHYMLGVDRLDYTKGIPFKLEAVRNALERFPELHGEISLVQVAVPSREDIPEYYNLKSEIERLVGEINGQFTRPGWVPIHYIFRSLERSDLLAYYRTCDIALVTPLKDGMNLVAKEYCAANLDESGVLLLSEFAGAAAQLKNGALLVNPYNIESVADGIYRAFVMDRYERRMRMRRLRHSIRKQDIFWWVDAFLRQAQRRGQSHFYARQFRLPRGTP